MTREDAIKYAEDRAEEMHKSLSANTGPTQAFYVVRDFLHNHEVVADYMYGRTNDQRAIIHVAEAK